MAETEPDRSVLLRALVTAFGDEQTEEIMADASAYSERQIVPGPVWMGLEGCWMFRRWGMVIGVEKDGYVHS